MKKLNKLRRVYLWYLVVTGELVCAAIIICACYINNPAWQTAIRILGIGGAVIVPVMVWILYRWIARQRDTATSWSRCVMRPGYRGWWPCRWLGFTAGISGAGICRVYRFWIYGAGMGRVQDRDILPLQEVLKEDSAWL